MAHKYTIEFDEETWRDLVHHAGRGNIKDYITHLLEREFRATRTRAIILCGGESADLYPTTIPIPKAMLPVNYRPVVDYLLQHLVYHGITDITMVAGQRGNVREYFGNLQLDPIDLEIVSEPEPTGTAGALRDVRNQVRGTFLVVNGDLLTNVDISAVLTAHRESGALASIVVTHPSQVVSHEERTLGRVLLTTDGRVRSLQQPTSQDPGRPSGPAGTPHQPDPGDPLHYNAGIYVLEPQVLEIIPSTGWASLEEHVLPQLIEERKVHAHVMHESDYWIDVADPRGFTQAWEDMLTGRFPTSS